MNTFDFQTLSETQEFLASQAMDDDYYEEPPDVDDSVRFCPECETPNQFGETCARCRREIQAEGREDLEID